MSTPLDVLIVEARDALAGFPPGFFRRGARLARWESSVDSLTVADGEAGRGVYFFFASDSAMSRYYRQADRRLASVDLGDGVLLADLTCPGVSRAVCRLLNGYAAAIGGGGRWRATNFQRAFWGLTWLTRVIREAFPEVEGYIVPHSGPGIPTSRQVILFDGARPLRLAA